LQPHLFPAICALWAVVMLTLPNVLTLSRIFAVPVLVWLLWWPSWHLGYGLAYGMYCLMGITDYFDGYLARARALCPNWACFSTHRGQDHGRGGDPGADGQGDRRLFAALVILLRIAIGPRISGRHPRLGAGVAARLEGDLPDGVAGQPDPDPGGARLVGAFHRGLVWLRWVTLWVAAALTVITGWDYLRVGLKHMD
jgi:CDP-diacylglycerol--glycerol-3-phosphate 3-phosphatidyltransferase/cardiolipin synthase